MKMTPKEYINNTPSKRATWWTSFEFKTIVRFYGMGKNVKYIYNFDKKQIKNKQVMLLSDHASRNVFFDVIKGFPCKRVPNIIIGYHNVLKKGLLKPMLKMGLIPKYLYAPDSRAAKNILRALKSGASLCLFPEGIQSTCGTTHPMNPATMKLVKKAGLDVVLCHTHGMYLSQPRYISEIRKGKKVIEYSILFTADEVKQLSEEQLYQKFLEKFRYNDFEWNKQQQNRYVGKTPNADGLNQILYYCPHCHSEFNLEIDDENIVCTHCGNTVHVDECYNLTPTGDSSLPFERIDEWYALQRKLVREEVQNPDFCLSYEADLIELITDKLVKNPHVKTGEGTVTLDRKGITFVGERNGEHFERTWETGAIPSFPFSPNDSNDIFYGEEYFCFAPKTDKLKVVKYMLIMEEIHNLTDPVWKKYSEDVYD